MQHESPPLKGDGSLQPVRGGQKVPGSMGGAQPSPGPRRKQGAFIANWTWGAMEKLGYSGQRASCDGGMLALWAHINLSQISAPLLLAV